MKGKKIYIVMYSIGQYDDVSEVIIFATLDKEMATQYRDRYNALLTKLKKFYKDMAEKDWVKWWKREFDYCEINPCYIYETHIR